jgi:hypothetical protein
VKTSVKVWSPAIVSTMNVKKSAGLIIGSVMLKKRRHGPAPSIADASYRCAGTAFSAAR